jgi:hypothetical protein
MATKIIWGSSWIVRAKVITICNSWDLTLSTKVCPRTQSPHPYHPLTSYQLLVAMDSYLPFWNSKTQSIRASTHTHQMTICSIDKFPINSSNKCFLFFIKVLTNKKVTTDHQSSNMKSWMNLKNMVVYTPKCNKCTSCMASLARTTL